MQTAPSQPFVRRWSSRAALAFALIVSCGQAWGQAPSRPGDTLERAAALIETGATSQAAVVLRHLLSVDPTNRRAREMLAFALESAGDLEGERQVRTALAREFPNDPRIQTDLARVLERSGEEGGALRVYRRARELSAGRAAPELDAAIDRMRGRTALEVGTPISVMTDPDATLSSVQAGAALPFGSRSHVALVGSHDEAEARIHGSATRADVLALSLVLRRGAASWTIGPRVHLVSPRGGSHRDLGLGGAMMGRATLGRSFEADWRAEAETPWDEAAVTVLHGGRTRTAEAHLYAHAFSRRLLLQAGARSRRLSILAADPGVGLRPAAWQSLRIAGADVVLWKPPGATVRGEVLDETLTAPTAMASAVTLAYRHYDVSTRTTPEFQALIALAPRGSVDEASIATTVASPRTGLGLELRTGLARDAARGARDWRVGGTLVWAPKPATHLGLAYEETNEAVAGLIGHRRAGRVSLHVDL